MKTKVALLAAGKHHTGREDANGSRMTRKRKCGRELLLEEVLEGLAGVAVAGRRGVAVHGRLLRVGGGRGVLLHGHAEFVELAIVARVFGGNALRDGLGALKLRAAIEEAALLAAMQLKIALGAGAAGVETVGEHRAAIGAATPRHRADHARRPRTELIRARTALRRLAVVRPFFLFALFCIAVTAVTILAIHKRLHTAQREKPTQGLSPRKREWGRALFRQALKASLPFFASLTLR